MVIELYFWRFVFYCFTAFILGYIFVYTTMTRNTEKTFNFFIVFKKMNLPDLFESLWKFIVAFIKFCTGIELEVFPAKK